MLNDLLYRLRVLFRRGAVEHELDDELQFHLERNVEKLTAAGLSRGEALRRARLEIGGVAQAKEATRQSWGVHLLDTLAQDVAYAVRMLRKSPGFTAVVVLSLALGIGANTAIFTLMDAVMWRMLPVKDPESLMVVAVQVGPQVQTGFNYAQYKILRDSEAPADLAGYTVGLLNVSIGAEPEPAVPGHLVTGEYFSLLGVSPIIGRAIGPEDDLTPNGHPVVMLSYGFWERRFARDPNVIGRTLRLLDTPFTIIGVTPPEFFGVELGGAPDLYAPIAMQPTLMPSFENLLENPIISRPWVQTIARPHVGFSSEQAAAVMDAAAQATLDRSDLRKRLAPAKMTLQPATAVSSLRRQFSRPLAILMAMVAMLLLIACANTANLLLARAAARRPEFAMRLAIGAGRGRLIRQLLVESVLLAMLGGLAGAVLASWATRLLVIYISSGATPVALDLSPNLRILAFTAAASVLTGLLFGLAPAWRSVRIDLSPALKNLGRVLTAGRGGLQPGRVLAVTQVALSVVLLIGAGLFARSLQKLNGEDSRAIRDSVLVARVEPRGSDQRGVPGTSERLDRTYQALIESVRAIPGVRFATASQVAPTRPTPNASTATTNASGERIPVPLLAIYPDYFATVGMTLAAGRDFNAGDLSERAPLVCIVNEQFTRQKFAGENPLGKPCFEGRRPRIQSVPIGTVQPYTIVGVVKDSRYTNPTGQIQPVAYVTFLQLNSGRGQMVLHARISGNRDAMIARIRQEVAKVDPTLPLFDIHTLEQEMDAALVQQRLTALLSGMFGALALVLACVGLYGLLAYGVTQRQRELGVRMALGAPRSHVVWMVMREASWLVGIGLLIGAPAACGVARLTSSQIEGLLFGLKATDPATIAAATLVLAVVAAVAAYLPARRASRVDPMVALRSE